MKNLVKATKAIGSRFYIKIAMPLLLTGRLKLVHEFLDSPAVEDLAVA